MVKFAHLGDCHLGSWRQPELQELNFRSFQRAVEICLGEKVRFVLVAGDLFDSAYPPIEILKQTFAEFRKLKEAGIKVFMIAGSHDYSISGKTFLDVLEKGGFCEICKYEERGEAIILLPLKFETFEIYGYPGKKSGLEVSDLKKIRVPESSNFRILLLHTSLTEAIGNLPIESISMKELPKAEYYALGHLHINFKKNIGNSILAYSGPIFPNSFQELEDLGVGSFYITEVAGFVETKRIDIKLKEVIAFNLEIKNALTATQEIIRNFDEFELADKIVLLRLRGSIERGTNADINYQKIKEYLDEHKACSFLKNTYNLSAKDEKIEVKSSASEMDKIEEELFREYENKNPDKFNQFIVPLIHGLNLQKQEDEKSTIYETRLLAEINKILGLELK